MPGGRAARATRRSIIRFRHLGADVVIDRATLGDAAIHIVDIGIGYGLQREDR